MWALQALRGDETLAERHHRQGTAYRRARQLYAAGYSITAVQYAVDGAPLAVWEFDGIRFKRIPKAGSW